MNGTIWLRMSLVLGLLLVSSQGCATGSQRLNQALVINTRENMGYLVGQTVKVDVTQKLLAADQNLATIATNSSSEDAVKRDELWLIFKAKPLTDLNGYWIVRLWCEQEKPGTDCRITLDSVGLDSAGKIGVFLAKVKGDGLIRTQMLYSRTPVIQQTWSMFGGEGVRELFKLAFFNAYVLEGDFEGSPGLRLKDKWEKLALVFNPSFSEQAAAIDKCQGILQELAEGFAVKGEPWLWKRTAFTANALKSKLKGTSQLACYFDDGTKLELGTTNFVPQLRQRLAFQDPSGKIITAELRLRTD